MHAIETYVRVEGDDIKNTNSKTLELWEKALSEDYDEIIPLKEGTYLIDASLYTQLLEACSYNKDLDPYNIPNINFSLIKRDDIRWKAYKEQRLKRGFDDSETWNLDSTISSFILPRLKVYKEVCAGYPGVLSKEEWDKTLDKMIQAFEFISKDEVQDYKVEVNEGLDLFRNYFFNLWW